MLIVDYTKVYCTILYSTITSFTILYTILGGFGDPYISTYLQPTRRRPATPGWSDQPWNPGKNWLAVKGLNLNGHNMDM